MLETRDLDAGSGYAPHKLVNSVLARLSLEVPESARQELYDGVGVVLDEIKDQIDITQIAIPVLLFSGDSSDLPDIFESSTQLERR